MLIGENRDDQLQESNDMGQRWADAPPLELMARFQKGVIFL